MAQWKKVIVSGSSPEFADVTLSGDLTVTGGDITIGSTSIFSGGDTTSLNNIDALDATTEATIESAIDTLGNLTSAGSLVTVGTLGSGAISSGFGNIDIGTSTLNAGNTTVDNFTNNSTVAASHFTGSFTGSFTGDGSNLTGVAQDIESLGAYGAATLHQTQDKFLVSDNGTEKSITFSNLEDSVFANVSGDATIAAGGALTIAATSVENSMLAGSIANAKLSNSTVSYGGVSLSLGGTDATPAFDLTDATNYPYTSLTGTPSGIVSGSSQIDHDATTNFAANEHFTQANITTVGTVTSGDVSAILPAGSLSSSAQVDHDSTTNFVADEHINHGSVTLTAGSGLTGGGNITTSRTFNVGAGTGVSVAADSISIGQAVGTSDNVTFNNVTVDGDLDVNGTVTTIQSTNLLVSDRFILMNSGSASGDGGIIIQTESTASGSGFVYDDTESRWGYQQGTKLAQDASTSTPDAYAAAVVTSDDANYQKNGNIRVEAGEIYIYIE